MPRVNTININRRNNPRPRPQARNPREQQVMTYINRFGPAAAAIAGGALTRGITGLIRGFGDYNIKSNSIMSPPEVKNSTTNGMIVRHREYLGDINATILFNLASYPLNPGIAETFPWLSSIANSFEQYRFRGILFEFKSMSSDAVLSTGANSALGSVIMSTQYDPLDSPFANKYQMENYQFANSAKPSITFIHPVECARSQTPIDQLFIRDGGVPANADIRLYDLGVFNLATVGMQANQGVIGELWVTYECELYKPKLIESSDPLELADHFVMTAPTNTQPFLTATLKPGSTLNSTLTTASIVLPVTVSNGLFNIIYAINGGSTALTRPTVTFFNCASVNMFAGNTIAYSDNGSTTAPTYIISIFIRVSGPRPVITFGTGGVYPTAATSADLYIIQLPGDITSTEYVNVGQDLQSDLTPTIDDDYASETCSDDEYLLTEMLDRMRLQRRKLKRQRSCNSLEPSLREDSKKN